MRTVAAILARRLLQAVFVALLVSTLCFCMARWLPGDIAYQVAGGRYGQDLTTKEAVEAVRAELRLDQPVLLAWVSWVGDVLKLDLGRSFSTGRPVWSFAGSQLLNTIVLSAAALGLSILLGPPLGLFAALRPNGLFDRASLALSVLLRSLPPFVIGIVLIILFAVTLRWLPAAGHTDRGTLLLPALTMAFGLAAISSRVTRTAMLDVARSDYFQFALTKGLPVGQVVLSHGVRNIAVPLVTHLGMQLVYLVEGVIIVETLFAWPGIGHALGHAVKERDIPMIQGTALAMGLLFVLFNALIDLVNVAIDPRLRRR